MRKALLAIVIAVVPAVGVAAAAEAPLLVNYQGVLRDAADKPLTGAYDMVFRLVDAPVGGTLLLTDYHTGPSAVAVSGGLFTALLGGGTLSPGTEATLQGVFSNHAAVYVEVQVGAETLNPRLRVVSAGYALNAARVGGAAASDFLDKSATAQVKAGQLTSSTGLVGAAPGAGNGVEGTSVSGYGVKGSSSSTSATTYGVYGVTASTSGTGVTGEATAASGNAWGVYGKTASSAGVGVLGSALAASGNTEGVRGQSTSPTGKGVVGGAFATSGANYGVYGETASPDGVGVYGHAVATSGSTTGVGGETFSSLGTGVLGVAHASSGDAWGVYGGTTSPTGYGVVADGNAGVIGNLDVTGAKNFLIEHPTEADQAIRYSCLEGGEVGVYQRGVARLSHGEARVVLPSHFPLVASGRVTVQVTPLEACGGLYAPEESVTAMGFTVRELSGGTSDAAFSYVVMAERIGYEGAEPVRPLSLGQKILISKHLSMDQKTALRGALARVEEQALDAATRGELYTSLQSGDFNGACRRLGGCLVRAPVIALSGPRDVKSPASATRAAPPTETSPGTNAAPAPEARAETGAQTTPSTGDQRPAVPVRPMSPTLLAEPHTVSEPVQAGDVLVLDRERTGALRRGTTALDPGVVGVAVEVPGAVSTADEAFIALVGTALCRVDASYGAIAAGDLLVASPTPGHAMRSASAPPGTVLGKALEPLEAGAGLIKMLVMPR